MRSNVSRYAASRLGRRWLTLLYPQLRLLPAEQWAGALERARSSALSPLEHAGVLAAVAIAAWVLQPLGDPAAGPLVRYLEQFMAALPLLALLVSPWLVRRTRRGLAHEASRSDGGESSPASQTSPRRDRNPLGSVHGQHEEPTS
jgi:hypothetical protein